MTEAASQAFKEQIKYDIDRFSPEDAEPLPSLFRKIYGNHYLTDQVYDPAASRRANADGSCQSLIARNDHGLPVGHLGIVQSAPYTDVRELGRDPTCCGLFGAALTNHVFSQRALWKADFVDVGFEIGFVPARMMQIEATGAGPTATVLQYRAMDDAPAQVSYLPSAYSDLMLALYDQLHLTRVVDLPRFDLVRINVRRIGADLPARVAAATADARRNRRTMVQLALALGSPCTDAAVEAMREAGFWFGALLPRWMDQDALLMQRAIGEPWFGGVELFTNDAKALLRYVQQDAARQPVLA